MAVDEAPKKLSHYLSSTICKETDQYLNDIQKDNYFNNTLETKDFIVKDINGNRRFGRPDNNITLLTPQRVYILS